MLDLEVTPEVADAIAEIGRVDPRYHSPEGVLFRSAIKVIEDERDWWNAPGTSGRNVLPCGRVQRCIISALTCAGFDYRVDLIDTIRLAIVKVSGPLITEFNAKHTHAEVIAMLTTCGHANGWL